MTRTDIECLGALDEAERTFLMDEESFRAFYDLTARPLWVYLARTTGDSRLADDLLQETYYRFLRTKSMFDSDDHRRHYLFRIATNLIRDQWRQPKIETTTDVQHVPELGDGGSAERAASRIDLARAMRRLTPRERSLLWLAYAQGWSYDEIAGSLGVKAASLKTMLHRARRRLIELLGGGR